MSKPSLSFMIVMAAVALPACDREAADPTAARMQSSDGKTRDETLSGALGRQIVIDPTRAATKRDALPAATDPGGKCDFAYDAAWARRLPAGLPLYPGARLVEAAGSDAPGCRRRIVSFTAAAAPAKVLAFYRAKATAAGFSTEHLVQQGADILGGTKGKTAYLVTIAPSGAPSGAGSTVDLIANAD